MENNIIQKDPFINKENNMNLLNINNISPFSFIKQISNTKNNQNIYNSKLILSNNISSNNINDQETNEKTYSFKPKKQETPNFSTKEEKDKRCKNLRESIEMNRKKLLENIKKMKDEKK